MFILYKYVYTCTRVYRWVSISAVYTPVPSIFVNSFSLWKIKKGKQTFWLLLCQFATPNSGLLTRISNFLFTLLFVPFVCWLVRSFVRLRVKINNFFCCCYFIRIYCAHFSNILWLLSYLSVLSAIYISNWYTFEIRHIRV